MKSGIEYNGTWKLTLKATQKALSLKYPQEIMYLTQLNVSQDILAEFK